MSTAAVLQRASAPPNEEPIFDPSKPIPEWEKTSLKISITIAVIMISCSMFTVAITARMPSQVAQVFIYSNVAFTGVLLLILGAIPLITRQSEKTIINLYEKNISAVIDAAKKNYVENLAKQRKSLTEIQTTVTTVITALSERSAPSETAESPHNLLHRRFMRTYLAGVAPKGDSILWETGSYTNPDRYGISRLVTYALFDHSIMKAIDGLPLLQRIPTTIALDPYRGLIPYLEQRGKEACFSPIRLFAVADASAKEAFYHLQVSKLCAAFFDRLIVLRGNITNPSAEDTQYIRDQFDMYQNLRDRSATDFRNAARASLAALIELSETKESANSLYEMLRSYVSMNEESSHDDILNAFVANEAAQTGLISLIEQIALSEKPFDGASMLRALEAVAYRC